MQQSRLWRFLPFSLLFVGVCAAATMIGLLFWLTAKIDRVEQRQLRSLIGAKIESFAEQVHLSTIDYSYWTFAYDLIESGDEDEIWENIGSGASAQGIFDQIFILGPDGALLHAFDIELGAQADRLYDPARFDALWRQLNTTRAVDYTAVDTIVRSGDQTSLVTAAWITPDHVAELPEGQFPAMLGIKHLDEERLATIMRDAGLSDISVMYDLQPVDDATQARSLILYDTDGMAVGRMVWDLDARGSELRQIALLPVLGVAAAILAVCAFVAYYFYRQQVALEHARDIATTDQLTGLRNRAGLTQRLAMPDIVKSMEQGQLAVIYLDLNGFKSLNDSLGHAAGDRALQLTAARLVSSVRDSDHLFRLGGDEFICLVTDPDPENTAIWVAERIVGAAQTPITIGAHDRIVSVSAGIAVAAPGLTWETVLSRSDAAMFHAKQEERGRPVVFSKGMGLKPDILQNIA